MRLYDREPEQLPRPRRARARERLERLAARARHHRRDVGKIRRLVAARGGLWGEIARQKVRAVRLEQELARRYRAHQRHEVRSAALVADPAGDADREAEREVGIELRLSAGEAVRDARVPGAVLAQDRDEVRMGVALVQEHRLAEERGKLELAVKGLPLRLARGEIAKVIEAAFADCRYFGGARERFE